MPDVVVGAGHPGLFIAILFALIIVLALFGPQLWFSMKTIMGWN